MNNIAGKAHIINTTSGIGYSYYSMTEAELQEISAGTASIQIPDGYYIGLELDLSESVVCSGIRFMTSDSSAALLIAKLASHEVEPDGYENSNYNYATAKMFDNYAPFPFKASSENQSTTTTNAPYRAFDEDKTTAWSPTVATLPVRLMIDFGRDIVINKYAIQESTSNLRFPKSWSIQIPASGVGAPGVEEDADWVDIHNVSGTSAPGVYNWTETYKFYNENVSTKYAIYITEVQTAAQIPAIANFKLIQADYKWDIYTPTWSGGYYEETFDSRPVRGVRIFYANNSSITQTVSGIQLLNNDEVVTVSGSAGTSSYQIGFTSDYSSIKIKNTGNFSGYAKALLAFTGAFDVDNSISISKGYEDYNWVGLNNFYSVPELYDWDFGLRDNLDNILEELLITDGQTEGTWTSPVLDVNEDFARAYIYGDGEISVEVRASDIAPAKLGFLITTTEYTHETLMYKHKRIYVDSTGAVIAEADCSPPSGDKKLWRFANTSFTGKPLRYYGSVNNRGTAAFLAPGLTTCADVGFETEAATYDNWYRLCTSTIRSSSNWNSGNNIDGLYWGENQEVIFTKTFPVDGSDGFFTFVISNNTELNVVQIAIAFQDGTNTRVGTGIITIADANLTGDDACDVIADVGNNAWWIYLGGEIDRIYKTDIGSIQSTCSFYWVVVVINHSGHMETEKIYKGFNYYSDVDIDLKKLIAIPYSGFTGFWAFDDENIYLYEEIFELGEVVLNLRRTITASTIDATAFTELHYGSCDDDGNLWIVDLDQERVLRCRLDKALNSEETDLFDFDASGDNVEGVLAVWAHPTDGSAYVFISDSTEFPGADVIKKVHFSQMPTSDSAFICEIPGFTSSTYKHGVSFTGCDFGDSVLSSPTNYYWGDSSALEWQPYISGRWLPTGRYKQLRVTLNRTATSDPSPVLRNIRLPKPLYLETISKQEEKEIIIKTDFQDIESYGTHQASIDVWWEYK